ncbi:MAG TPA: ATP-binding protein [Burkholderiaceae bacterium]|jgi:signal transduction histidine kinase/CheY-like chemotaxis protein
MQELSQADRLQQGQEAWHAVALPDTWLTPTSSALQDAIYVMHFHLDAAPRDQLWGLSIDRLVSRHRLYLNGQLISAGDPEERLRMRSLYLPLTPQLLRQGDNELRLEARFSGRAGLSRVKVGPDLELLPLHEASRWLDTRWPQYLNMAGAAFAGGMLLLWWRRRQERAAGLFGTLWLVASLRNFDYYVTPSPLPPDFSAWLYYLALCSNVTVMGLFALELSGQARPRFRRLLWWTLLVLPALGALATLLGRLTLLQLITYPLLMGLGLGTVPLLWRMLKKQRGAALAWLLLCMVVLILAAAHDYLCMNAGLPVTEFYWLGYAVPFGMASYAALLMNRLVQGLAYREELSLKLERRVTERTSELAEANAAKTRFLAAASHDLRQPVTAIGLLAGLLRERLASASAPVLMSKLEQAVQALDDLLSGLLDLSRLDAGTKPPAPQAVSLQALFDAIALHEQPHAQAKGLRLRFVASDAVAASDPLLLEQMLRNLVSNGLRYTQRGGVVVGVRRRAERLQLQVWDSGCGIAPEHEQQIFEEFVQLDNPHRDRSKGQGLGLAIVRRSAALLGHAVGVQSRPGRGSCFWIELPHAAAVRVEPKPVLQAGQPLLGQSLWILEDDGALREALTARLQAWGADVRALASLADLRRALAECESAPRALLSDHRLPDGDSEQALLLFTARFGDGTAVVMTGDVTLSSEAMAAHTRRGVPVLHKPFRAEVLLPLLQLAPAS